MLLLRRIVPTMVSEHARTEYLLQAVLISEISASTDCVGSDIAISLDGSETFLFVHRLRSRWWTGWWSWTPTR